MITVLEKESNEPYICRDETALISELYKPVCIEYQQTSDLLESMIKMYANDVVRYDRAVGSKTFNKRLKAEFEKRLRSEDSKLIRLINNFHPKLMVKAG